MSHPPIPRWVSMLGGLGLLAYALFDAAQPRGTPSPVTIVSGFGIPLADKWVHICGYGAVALLLCQALIGPDGTGLPKTLSRLSSRLSSVSQKLASGLSGRRKAIARDVSLSPVDEREWGKKAIGALWAVLTIVLLATLGSAIAEVIQAYSNRGRSAEFDDIFASGLGAAIAGVAFLFCRWV